MHCVVDSPCQCTFNKNTIALLSFEVQCFLKGVSLTPVSATCLLGVSATCLSGGCQRQAMEHRPFPSWTGLGARYPPPLRRQFRFQNRCRRVRRGMAFPCSRGCGPTG
eukprot:EG_transcript_61903